MAKICQIIEDALVSGSRSKSFGGKIRKLCNSLPDDIAKLTDKDRADIIRLAAACRATKAITVALTITELPSIDNIPEFIDLICETYYPVMEDGKRTVGFWSVKDSAILAHEDVHEWVRDRQIDKKTGNSIIVPVPFGKYWRAHKPDYTLYGVAADRAQWNSKVIDCEDRPSVNIMYDRPPVITEKPINYGDGVDAQELLDAILERTIVDDDLDNAKLKRDGFVLDAGAHLLALRDFGTFRCRKIFCFTSTNKGQGTGKSFLHESLTMLVPRDASCVVPTTELGGDNLLPLYGSSVCVLTEAPSTANDRYTAEHVKAFADSGWKTATEKYIAKRAVNDNSLKLLSSNHLAPLPVDSVVSRRMEFFVSATNSDGGAELRNLISLKQKANGWASHDVRRCVGWALLERALKLMGAGYVPCEVARRSIDASHILSYSDYDYFIANGGSTNDNYSDYKDFRSDKGFTWSPDAYKFENSLCMSRSKDKWLENSTPKPKTDMKPEDTDPDPTYQQQEGDGDDCDEEDYEEAEAVTEVVAPPKQVVSFQYKTRMAKKLLEPNTITPSALYHRIVNDPRLKVATEKVRDGSAEKKFALPQIFPSTVFERYTRRENILDYTGFTHIDFDNITENGNGLTPEQVRDALAELPGFVIGALSSRGNGAWAIFWAGYGVIESEDQYTAAIRTLYRMCEEKVSMLADDNPRLPTCGRIIAHDADCRIADEVVCGGLPEPYEWKAPTFSVATANLEPCTMPDDMSPVEKVNLERFMEVVVQNSCDKLQSSVEGERHSNAIKAVSNVILCCKQRGVTPLSSWGRKLRDACLACGLPKSEVRDIMRYWKQKTGVNV